MSAACPICGSVLRYKDDSGFEFCRACGTQSQDLPESFEVDDHDPILKGAIRKSMSSKKRVRDLPITSEPEASKQPTAHELLSAYQLCLKRASHALQSSLGLPAEFGVTVSRLWFDFLERWMLEARFSIVECFTVDLIMNLDPKQPVQVLDPELTSRKLFQQDVGHDSEAEEDAKSAESDTKMEVFLAISDVAILSMPFLTGFLNLACRIMRLTVLPYDLHRMILNGSIPYLRAWNDLAPSVRDSLSAYQSFFKPKEIPSCSSILLCTQQLACALRIVIPQFNELLIAQKMARDLGLPNTVFQKYISRVRPVLKCVDMQCLGLSDPLSRSDVDYPYPFDSTATHMYEQTIMAALVIAWKNVRDFGANLHMCSRFNEPSPPEPARDEFGELLSPEYPHPDPFFEMPESTRELDMLPRSYLDKFLEHLRRIKIHDPRTEWSHSSGLEANAMDSMLAVIESQWKDAFCDECVGPQVFATPLGPYYYNMPEPTQAVYCAVHGMTTQLGVSYAYTYAMSDARETTGAYHPAYTCAVERAARLIGCGARMIHELVTNMELAMLQLRDTREFEKEEDIILDRKRREKRKRRALSQQRRESDSEQQNSADGESRGNKESTVEYRPLERTLEAEGVHDSENPDGELAGFHNESIVVDRLPERAQKAYNSEKNADGETAEAQHSRLRPRKVRKSKLRVYLDHVMPVLGLARKAGILRTSHAPAARRHIFRWERKGIVSSCGLAVDEHISCYARMVCSGLKGNEVDQFKALRSRVYKRRMANRKRNRKSPNFHPSGTPRQKGTPSINKQVLSFMSNPPQARKHSEMIEEAWLGSEADSHEEEEEEQSVERDEGGQSGTDKNSNDDEDDLFE